MIQLTQWGRCCVQGAAGGLGTYSCVQAFGESQEGDENVLSVFSELDTVSFSHCWATICSVI